MSDSPIGKRIKYERKAAGLTQSDLAAKIGVAASMIGQWETDARTPKPETLDKIAAALNVSTDRLLYDSVVKKEIIPGRAWVIEIDDPALNNYIFRIEATDSEAFECVQNMMASVAGDISLLTPEARIAQAYNKLNDAGKIVAVERIEELTKISDYQAVK